MKHYVLLKLAPGTDAEAVYKKVWSTCEALDKELSWLNFPEVHRSCVESGSNADIMAVFELENESQLQTCLTHPLYLEMARELEDVVAECTLFDHY